MATASPLESFLPDYNSSDDEVTENNGVIPLPPTDSSFSTSSEALDFTNLH
jgi:hypothetical protein